MVLSAPLEVLYQAPGNRENPVSKRSWEKGRKQVVLGDYN